MPEIPPPRPKDTERNQLVDWLGCIAAAILAAIAAPSPFSIMRLDRAASPAEMLTSALRTFRTRERNSTKAAFAAPSIARALSRI